jgi:hypothetical protein
MAAGDARDEGGKWYALDVTTGGRFFSASGRTGLGEEKAV